MFFQDFFGFKMTGEGFKGRWLICNSTSKACQNYFSWKIFWWNICCSCFTFFHFPFVRSSQEFSPKRKDPLEPYNFGTLLMHQRCCSVQLVKQLVYLCWIWLYLVFTTHWKHCWCNKKYRMFNAPQHNPFSSCPISVNDFCFI